MEHRPLAMNWYSIGASDVVCAVNNTTAHAQTSAIWAENNNEVTHNGARKCVFLPVALDGVDGNPFVNSLTL